MSFAAMVPIVAEGMMATARGNNLAKLKLSPELYKKVLGTNKYGAISYIAAAVFVWSVFSK